MHRITDRAFFAQDALTLARALLGKYIVHEVDGEALTLRITETEAYLGVTDKASHSRGGRITARNRIMFGPPGFAYLFLVYGLHWCFNITCNREGQHEAVLIRAGESVAGTATLLKNRGLDGPAGRSGKSRKLSALADGPGKLAMALGLGKDHNGLDLTDEALNPTLYIAWDEASLNPGPIIEDERIGIDYAAEYRTKPWRFYLEGRVVSLTKEKRLQRKQRHV